MSKFTWDDMKLCRDCHYKNENPDLCNSEVPPREKPAVMARYDDCGRYIRESKWQRMGEKHRKDFEHWKNG